MPYAMNVKIQQCVELVFCFHKDQKGKTAESTNENSKRGKITSKIFPDNTTSENNYEPVETKNTLSDQINAF